ncbi:MAG: hypothetical protein A3H79_04355 [Candidatus Levybacteria bacterium RIFCSPLOWO2_02_FULL_36_8b]|nr:MAG: hypothetical protein A3H79_04355 [Candidatus Levybacteria bacterium RIFCSPLOWO2_02_FULL_36_8b]
MNALFKNIKSDKILLWSTVLSLFLILFNLAYTLFSYSSLPPLVAIYNQMPWGEGRLGLKIEIFIPVIIAFLIFISNLIFSGIFYNKMPLISRILCTTNLLTSFLSLLIVARTIRLVV